MTGMLLSDTVMEVFGPCGKFSSVENFRIILNAFGDLRMSSNAISINLELVPIQLRLVLIMSSKAIK